jgi:RB1-inducible coiled-coil protein 1
LVSSGKVTVASVDRGDTVMLVWNEDHNNFSVYTEPSGNLPLHFLHNESIQILGLTVPPNNLAKRYCTAEVVDKEYCQAKKSENRFKVPQGTKFYRVRCKSASCPMTKSVSNGNEN